MVAAAVAAVEAVVAAVSAALTSSSGIGNSVPRCTTTTPTAAVAPPVAASASAVGANAGFVSCQCPGEVAAHAAAALGAVMPPGPGQVALAQAHALQAVPGQPVTPSLPQQQQQQQPSFYRALMATGGIIRPPCGPPIPLNVDFATEIQPNLGKLLGRGGFGHVFEATWRGQRVRMGFRVYDICCSGLSSTCFSNAYLLSSHCTAGSHPECVLELMCTVKH